MSFRRRLQLTALATLVIGLGAVLVVGNVLLERRVDAETTSLLRGRAEAQLAALTVTAARVRVRESPNDTELDRQSWVFDGDRVVERPAGVDPPWTERPSCWVAAADRSRAAVRAGRACSPWRCPTRGAATASARSSSRCPCDRSSGSTTC
jgi:hypothetical protein